MLRVHAIFNDPELAEQSTHLIKPDYDAFSENCEYRLYWYKGEGEPPIRALLNPPLAESDLANVELVREHNCSLFDMADDEQSYLYKSIKNRIYSGWYTLTKEEFRWESGKALIWLEWAQNYYNFTYSKSNE